MSKFDFHIYEFLKIVNNLFSSKSDFHIHEYPKSVDNSFRNLIFMFMNFGKV